MASTAGDQKSGLQDKYGLRALMLRAASPSAALEDEQNWIERGVDTQPGHAADAPACRSLGGIQGEDCREPS
jgi:hypothetical protein